MRVIILLLLISIIVCQEKITCQTKYDSTNTTLLSIYRSYTFLSNSDSNMIKVMTPFSIISSVLIVVFYCCFKITRQQPGDIILGIAISQVFLMSGFLSTVVYNMMNPLPPMGQYSIPESFGTFCKITGYLIILPFCIEFIYNVSFCIFFIVTVKNVLKSWHKEKWIVHTICIVLTGIVALVLTLTDQIGISLFGVCGLKLSFYSPFFRSGLIITYTVVLILSTVYFKRRFSKIQNDNNQRKLFMRYNFTYIIVMACNLILQTAFDLIAAISCQNLSLFDTQIIGISVTLSNTFNLITPILICLVMISHPEVWEWFRNFYIKRFRINRNVHLNQKGEVELQNLGQNTNRGLLTQILSLNKSRLVYSILCAIVVEDRQVTGCENLVQINDWNYKDKIIIKMKQSQNLLNEFGQMTLQNMNLIDVQITSYCPRVFKTLMKRDGFNNILNCLNPKNNEKSIRQLSQGSGGKSGQFFFFSHDNRLILKTLSKKQLDVLLSRLKNLVKHYEHNPNSLITKVYGVYTLISKQTGQEYHLYLMKNLTGCDKKFITKTYDLKGSRLDRKVLKIRPQQIYQSQKIKETMKDLDFEEIEKKLQIDKEHAACLKQILTKDAQFLSQQGLIDYSLIVMKMNLNEYLQENQMLLQQFRTKMVNPYGIIQSTRTQGTAYVIGLIDYLQTWTTKKKGEKLTKVLLFLKFKTSLQVSAQAPQAYSTRFIEKVVNKIL